MFLYMLTFFELIIYPFILCLRYGTGEEATTLAIQAFDRLARKLRSLELPLKITTVHSTSEVSRHARVFPPLGKNGKQKSEVRMCILYLLTFIT